jgi:hypothetical protein
VVVVGNEHVGCRPLELPRDFLRSQTRCHDLEIGLGIDEPA